VNPLDCTRAQALRYVQNGISAIELEVLSLCDDVLKRAKRGYTYAFFQQQLSFFQEHDVDVGVVLSPGIFGSSFVHCCETVERCIKLGIDFVRIYPVCVYEGTKLEQWFLQDRYEPLGLSETVTIVREMMDRLAYSGIEVIRVGRQDTHDGLSVSVAGPNHSNVRGLIENRRFFDKISAQLCAQGESITHIVVHPKDVSLAKGVQGDTIRHLRARLERDLVLTVDTRVPRGSVWTRKKDE
jgi:histone acetyltransferase (RNA polymerase elongator complex component)